MKVNIVFANYWRKTIANVWAWHAVVKVVAKVANVMIIIIIIIIA
jgi:hypothetical protein